MAAAMAMAAVALHFGLSPLKTLCCAATVALVSRPRWPSVILPLFRHFLLRLASLIPVFRHWCLSLRTVSGESDFNPGMNRWKHAMFDNILTQIYCRPTRRLAQNSN